MLLALITIHINETRLLGLDMHYSFHCLAVRASKPFILVYTARTPRSLARRDVQREIVDGLERLALFGEVVLDGLIGMGGYAEIYDGSILVSGETERRTVALKRFRVILKEGKEFAGVR